VQPEAIHLTGGLSRSPTWRQMIADVFEVETVPVEGEGAALGAAIHAAWVWAKEQGRTVSLAEVAEPFVVLDVARRKKPIARNVEICRMQKRLYLALSYRARGIETDEDPFELRAVLSVLSGGSP
jgi:xylulokinase